MNKIVFTINTIFKKKQILLDIRSKYFWQDVLMRYILYKTKNLKIIHNKPGPELIFCCFLYRTCKALKQHFCINPNNQKRLLKCFSTTSVSPQSTLCRDSKKYHFNIRNKIQLESREYIQLFNCDRATEIQSTYRTDI